MFQYKNYQRVIAGLLTFFLTVQIGGVGLVQAASSSQLFGGGFLGTAQAANPAPQNHYGIIAVLVDDALMNNQKNYDGLTATYTDNLKAKNLPDRIRRYAADAQGSQEFTKSLIIKIPANTKVEDVAHALEKLYLEGDGSQNEINKLVGVVTIGNVPLPVVNKKGNRFVSLFPYTDFEDKVYIFDAASGDYLPNPNLQTPKAEVWHGVIQPPVAGDDGNALLASYFDKNHLYHLGIPEFAIFDKKLLMADLFNEFAMMNKFQFKSYWRYIAHWSDLAYERFDKHLAEKLLNEVNGGIAQVTQEIDKAGVKAPPQSCDKECVKLKNARNEDFDADGYSNGYELEVGSKGPNGNIPTDPRNPDSVPVDYTNGSENRTNPDPKKYVSKDDGSKQDYPDPPNNEQGGKDGIKQLPDIQSRQLILNFVSKYVQLFDKFLANANDWANFTGRYDAAYQDADGNTRSDIHSLPSLISIKDQFTEEYLKKVNDAIERKIDEKANQLQTNITMIQQANIIGLLFLDNDPQPHELLPTSYVNFSTQKYLGLFDTLFLNGVPAFNLHSVADCSLYRGSNDNTGKNSVMVKAVRTYDPVTANGDPDFNKQYAGCYGVNYNHPERCFETKASQPIYDIAGAREVDPATVPESATNYRACFDFKEKSHFEQYQNIIEAFTNLIEGFGNEELKKAVQFPPMSPYKPANEITLYDQNGVTITLADVLKKLNIPEDDWRQIGERLLQKNGQFTLENPFPGVAKIQLNVTAEPATAQNNSPVELPSISYHKEPTQDIHNKPYTSIAEQLKAGGYTLSLPIDNPRFVTFKDAQDVFRKVIYPDTFSAANFNSYLQSLQAKEDEINGILASNGLAPDPHFLTNIVKSDLEQLDPQDLNQIAKTSAPKLEDAFGWRDMDIDQKHDYVLKTYLSPSRDPYVEKMKNGYEAMYFVSRGSGDTFETQFNGDYPEEDKDPQLKDAQDPPPTPETQPADGDGVSQNVGEDGIPLLDWFQAMVDWIKQTTNQMGAAVTVAPVCSISDGDFNVGGGNGAGKNGPNQAKPDNTVKLRVSSDKKVVKAGAGDAVKIKVEGVSSGNQLQTGDNHTLVDLSLVNPAGKTIVNFGSTHPVSLAGGVATFTLLSTNDVGSVKISATAGVKTGAANGADAPVKKLSSNSITLNATRGKIKILSYVRATDNVYTQKTASGFIVKDGSDNIIAEVDGKTGMVTVKDDRFQLAVLASVGSKPVRLGVQNKNTNEIVASVFFVADIKKPVALDDVSVDYGTTFEKLEGVHVKDLLVSDTFVAQSITNGKFNVGGVYLKNNETQKKFGIIDTAGNIFLMDGFSLQLKGPAQPTDPVIFQVVDKNGKALFEIYIGAKFSKIQIIKAEGNFEKFNEVGGGKFIDGTLGEGPLRAREGLSSSDPSADNLSKSSSGNGASKSSKTNLIPDFDKDGLNDLEENLIGTDPKNIDSDGDGIPDGEEVKQNMNPLKKNAPLFQDLNPQHEGFQDILRVYKRGIISGYADGTFKPDQLLTREEFVKLDLGAICVNCTKFSPQVLKSVDTCINKLLFLIRIFLLD